VYQALRAAVDAIAGGNRDYVALEKEDWLALERAAMRPDYFTILSALDLSKPDANMAGDVAGYAVIMIDFHGSAGYGQAFTDTIRGQRRTGPREGGAAGWPPGPP